MAPDRRQAAEMVLIRLCHVADLPPPGELVRRLPTCAGRAAHGPRSRPHRPPGSGARAVAGGARAGAGTAAASPPAAPAPRLAELPRRGGAGRRAAGGDCCTRHLLHSVHLVRFAPPVIELRPQPDAPRDLASRLAALLLAATGTRWTIALSTADGRADARGPGRGGRRRARREDAAAHPLVQAILDAFPGARIEPMRGGGYAS